MRIFFITLLSIAVIAASVAFYTIFFKPQSPNVELAFVETGDVFAGTPFEVAVSYANYSERTLFGTSLSVILPDKVVFAGRAESQRVAEESLGDLGPGSVGQKTFKLLAIGDAQTVKRLEATMRYMAKDGGAQFEKRASTEVVVADSAGKISFTGPQGVFSGENFDVQINYSNDSDEDLKNIRLTLKYPPAFRFIKADPAPESDNNEWRMGTLARHSNDTIMITGNVVGGEKTSVPFEVSMTAEFLGERYTLATLTGRVDMSSPPLALSVSVNDSQDYVAMIGDELRYLIAYKNNSETPMRNVIVKAVLAGELFNMAKVRTNAAVNSLAGTFTWNVANTPELAVLEPGAEGALTAEIDLKDAFTIRRVSDKNYSVKIKAQIESPTVPAGVNAQKTISTAEMSTKVAGYTDMQARAYYIDSTIPNAGPYPPEVNRATTYTVHWVLTNYATDMSNVKVSAFLQNGSRFTGKIKTNADTAPVYNPLTGEVEWELARIPAGKGIMDKPLEASFQIENMPSANQLGQNIILIGKTKLMATDEFAGRQFETTDSEITSDLPDDTKVANGDRRVGN